MPGIWKSSVKDPRHGFAVDLLMRHPAITLGLIIWLSAAVPTQAQLRIVTYNTAGKAFISSSGTGNGPTDRIDTVLKAIGQETGNNGKVGGTLLTDGIAKPIDILLLQEQNLTSSSGVPDSGSGPGAANDPSPTTQSILSLLNSAYSGQGVTYSMSSRTGSSDGAGTQTLIYRNETVQWIDDIAFGYSGQDRQTLRYHLRPKNYTSAADFYIYNSHYKASQDSPAPGTNATKRYNEADAIRINSDALLEGAHAIYSGDHNFYHSDSQEPAWGRLVQSGPGQANDPANQVGDWTSNSSFAAIHTQSPCLTASSSSSTTSNCGVGGGMDDRFDFQLVTGEFLDGQGLSYIANSYHTFGNNGSTYNKDINDASNTVTFPVNLGNTTTTFPTGSTFTKSQMLSALHTVTDHLPVVADYQIPAMMQAVAGTIPSSIDLGSTFNLGVTVTNSAPVSFSNGADVLHYSLTTSGSVTGSFLNQNETALGGSNNHNVGFNTSSIGMKSGTITVTSTNQGIPNGTINIPISFLVVLPGDYNLDGAVDARDYIVWRKNSNIGSGATYSQGDGNRDGAVNVTDYNIWRSHFGQTASGSGAGMEFGSTVPEPSSFVLVLIGICLASRRATRLNSCSRQT
jgi:hypothetical protein